jgi:hypothetical protein
MSNNLNAASNNFFDSEERIKARKRLYDLCLKSINSLRDVPELEQPTEEQSDWVDRTMKRGWNNGRY